MMMSNLFIINSWRKAVFLSALSFIMIIPIISVVENWYKKDRVIMVPGHIHGKYTGQETNGNYREDTFTFIVRPIDKQYNDYSVVVDYATFVKHKIGDVVEYNVSVFAIANNSNYNTLFRMPLVLLMFFTVTICSFIILSPILFYQKKLSIQKENQRIDN